MNQIIKFIRRRLFKTLFVFILFLITISGYAQVVIGTNFSIRSNIPVDSRMVVNDLTARDAINELFRFQGMKVFVLSTSTEYQLISGITNSDWSAIVSSQWSTNVSDIYYTTGKVGIGTTNPSSTFSVGSTSQFQVNSTGNITKINNITTSFPSSQGSANSYLANDGSGNLIWEATPAGAKYKITAEGGYAIRLINKSGVTVNKGAVVQTSSTDSNSFTRATASSNIPFGIVYDNSITDGTECWVVVSGIAEVYFEGSVTQGTWAGTSDINPGEAQTTFSAGVHDQEIGHAISSRTGAGLAKIVINFR